ncbi:cation diffusion facilitator family transporter [Ruegeria marisrubri]|uniref:cation diffusion facilitator family transporter n=1 Tax=Ruegeria marisrubri TaxID=1685379 RepID=UPI0009E6B465|nr:cation diffusion facilitator family transporter [Ruegeria marisrubri]
MAPSKTALSLSAAIASVAVAISLIALKTWAFAETKSLSIAATLADSALDLLVSASGLAAIAYAARPPDQDHAYGHSSAEDLAALGQALFLVGAAAVLAVVSVRRLLSDEVIMLEAEGTGIAVMLASILLTLLLVLWQRYVARRTGNRVVAADSLHYLSDLVPNLGAVFALWVSARFGVTGVDSAIALLTSVILVYGAFRIGNGAWDALMDRGASPELVAAVEQIISDYPEIEGFHDMRTRTAGGRVFFDFHVEIDGSLPLSQAHEIGAGLKRRILAAHPEIDVLIHKDPYRPALPANDRRSSSEGDDTQTENRRGNRTGEAL